MYKNYAVTSVKMPVALRKKIDVLAAKIGRTRNGWIVQMLARAAKWDGDK